MTNTMPSDRTLDRALKQAHDFLGAVGTRPELFRAMSREGYSRAHHVEGWQRVLAASGYTPPDVGEESQTVPASFEAMRELDQQDGPLLTRLDALLTYDHPAQASFILHELNAGSEVEAVLNVKAVLDRLDLLASSPDREATREADHAALETLAGFGMGDAWREQTRALVERAQATPEDAALLPVIDEEELRARKFAVYRWIRRWSKLARIAITNRNHLISLGLAERSTAEGDTLDDLDLDADA